MPVLLMTKNMRLQYFPDMSAQFFWDGQTLFGPDISLSTHFFPLHICKRGGQEMNAPL